MLEMGSAPLDSKRSANLSEFTNLLLWLCFRNYLCGWHWVPILNFFFAPKKWLEPQNQKLGIQFRHGVGYPDYRGGQGFGGVWGCQDVGLVWIPLLRS